MDELKDIFGVNYSQAIPNPECILQGEKYRITILTERLVRFEYNENGSFEDRPTEFVKNRKFPKPNFEKNEDDKRIYITTNYRRRVIF